MDALRRSGPLKLRLHQVPPDHQRWLTWLLIGGRGSGKTHAGAEWVNGLANGFRPFAQATVSPIALIGETFADVREVMIDGPAGIRAKAVINRPTYEVSRRRLLWPNGAIAYAFSAEDPESLRGPQFAAAWCDELAKWKHPRATWDMLQFGLRLGDHPRQLVTTTPRPIELLKTLMQASSTVQTHMTTDENSANLAGDFIQSVHERYDNTPLGRQELGGEMMDERDEALWSRETLEACRRAKPGPLARIVVAVDPPATSKVTSDACGIVVAGVDEKGNGWVLGDHSVERAKPNQWASKAIAAYHANAADLVIAEVNQGGEMVASIIHSLDPTVPVKAVYAKRGKFKRAEPVAALYSQNRVRHCGLLDRLEDEMCDFSIDGLSNGHSPDRLDALVWALTELMLSRSGSPRVRGLN
ncbi:MAG: terminase family protein [Ahrensia sp.]